MQRRCLGRSAPSELILERGKVEPQLQVVRPLPDSPVEVARAAHHVLLCCLRALLLRLRARLCGPLLPCSALLLSCTFARYQKLSRSGHLQPRPFCLKAKDTGDTEEKNVPAECSDATSRGIRDSCPNLERVVADCGSLRWWMRQRFRRPSRSRFSTAARK